MTTMIAGFTAAALVAAAVSDPAWTASLRSPDGAALAATARVEQLGGDSLRITIDVRGAEPGGSVPWSLYRGRCSALGAVHGSRSAYPDLALDLSGETWEVASVAAPLQAGQTYAVAIGEPGTRPSACGNLEAVVAGRN